MSKTFEKEPWAGLSWHCSSEVAGLAAPGREIWMGDLDVDELAQDVAPTQCPFGRIYLVQLSLFPVCPWELISGWVSAQRSHLWPLSGANQSRASGGDKRIPPKAGPWPHPRSTLGAPPSPLRQQELPKWSCLGINAGRASSGLSTFPFGMRTSQMELWARQWCHLRHSLLPHRTCKALPSPSFRATRTEMEKSVLKATRTRSLKWWSVCVNARWDLARECLF